MLKHIVIATAPLPETHQHFEVEDVCKLLEEQFMLNPALALARVYHKEVSREYDVTPTDQATFERLNQLDGPICVIVEPAEGAEWVAYIIEIILVVTAVVMASNIPKPVTSSNSTQVSPNNDLAERTNTVRPLGRINDIYGTLRCTPDLLMKPYSEYSDNIEYEHAYMCIGRGYYTILDAKDDTTPISTIDGAGITVYGPYDSPNSLLTPPSPRTTFGLSNAVPVLNVARCTAVNGQDLLTDSADEAIGSNLTMAFSMSLATGRGTIVFSGGEDLSVFSAGDSVYLYAKGYKTHHTTHDIFISGTYTIYSCDSTTLVLANVQSVARDWGWIAWTGEYGFTQSHVVAPLALSVGPFLLPQAEQTEVWVNIIATNGMYQLDGSGTASTVTAIIKAIIQPTDVRGNPTGTPYTGEHFVYGDATKVTIADTWKISLFPIGPCTIALYRATASPVNQQVVDGIKWKDLYSITPVTQSDFGDVTTVYAVTKATSGALSVKERKLNMLVQRLLPARIGVSDTFTDTLTGTNDIAPIFCAIAMDPHIGNRQIDELDVTSIYDTSAQIAEYYGTTDMAEFSYTFDSDNLSFEEIVATMMNATNCVAYRQGRKMKLSFEQATDDSIMLFGHRNKVPSTETRTLSFGSPNAFDSVEYTYISDVDDTAETLYIPTRGINPNKFTSQGVRKYAQAWVNAWRMWQKVRYGNLSTEFEALQEATVLLMNDRILVADGTRSNARDGEVIAQTVLELEISQPMTFEAGKSYVIFLQGVDGFVESIPIAEGSSDYHIILGSAPTITLSLDENASVRTLYWIVPTDDVRPQAFLVTAREPATAFTEKVTAVNYDSRYYLHDPDVINGVISASAPPPPPETIPAPPVPPGP